MVRRGGERGAEWGDWQTPALLAEAVVDAVEARWGAPSSVLEPTCGVGGLLVAAARRWPRARLVGFERHRPHAAEARASLARDVSIRGGDLFEVDWEAEVAALPTPLLILANPPWVTASALGALSSSNRPAAGPVAGLRGLDARTGRAGFDVTEWAASRLLDAAEATGVEFRLALLCKRSVARRLMERRAARGRWLAGEVRDFDARRHFGASVDAVLLLAEAGPAGSCWGAYDSLTGKAPARLMGVVDGEARDDLEAFERSAALALPKGAKAVPWRSGIKHDCASILELSRRGDTWVNGVGERVEVEPSCVWPLAKGSDLAANRAPNGRALLLPQCSLTEDPADLALRAPHAWAYLQARRDRFDARRSSVYAGRPPFSVFGIGPYAFAPYKVAVSGLHARPRFIALGPEGGRPVLLDDTSYLLPCQDAEEAGRLAAALNAGPAQAFFAARAHRGAKRPITASLLRSLALATE